MTGRWLCGYAWALKGLLCCVSERARVMVRRVCWMTASRNGVRAREFIYSNHLDDSPSTSSSLLALARNLKHPSPSPPSSSFFYSLQDVCLA